MKRRRDFRGVPARRKGEEAGEEPLRRTAASEGRFIFCVLSFFLSLPYFEFFYCGKIFIT